MEMVVQLAQHAAILIVLSVLYCFLTRIRCSSITGCQIIQGVLFGSMAIAAMKMAISHSSGFVYDGRSVVLALAGLFGGWLTAGIAVIIGGVYLCTIGGTWVCSGLMIILVPAITGLVFRVMARNQPHSMSFPVLFLFSFVVHLIMFICPLFVSGGYSILKQTWLPILLVFPLTTLIMAFLMRNEEKRALTERALRESEENFRLSIDESPLGMHIVSDSGETLYANKAFLDLYGFSSIREFMDTPSEVRYTPESYREHLERKKKRKKGEYVDPEYDIEIIRTDGRKCYLRVNRKKINWNGIPQFHVIHQDITENKRMVLDLQAAKEKVEESDRLKSAFLANISHEIRTPLNVILGFTEMLIHDRELKQETSEEYSGIIKRNADELLQTISNVIDISKLEQGQMNLLKSHEHVQPLIDDLRSNFTKRIENKDKKQVLLIQKMPEIPVYIRTDKERFIQIFSNLLDNSVKFTNQGVIMFGVADVTETHILFFVSDTGIGIEESIRTLIFENFRQAEHSITRSYRGTGLGLSIVSRLIGLMDGEISLESEVGKGTVVRFRLPLL